MRKAFLPGLPQGTNSRTFGNMADMAEKETVLCLAREIRIMI